MLVSRHRIGEYLPEVVHQGPDPAAVAVCREVLAESGAECVILHGSRGWGGWDEQSDLNLIVVQRVAADRAGRHGPPGNVGAGQGAALPRLPGRPRSRRSFGLGPGMGDPGVLRRPPENTEPSNGPRRPERRHLS